MLYHDDEDGTAAENKTRCEQAARSLSHWQNQQLDNIIEQVSNWQSDKGMPPPKNQEYRVECDMHTGHSVIYPFKR